MVLTLAGWLLLLLALALFFFGVVGFIAPRTVKQKDGTHPTRLRMFFVAWLAPILPAAFGLVMVLPSAPRQAETAAQNIARTLSAADLKSAWPLTVPNVIVHCEDSSHLTLEANNVRYQLIGSANPDARGWRPRQDIWSPSDTVPGLRRDIGELIEVASAHCTSVGKPLGGT